MTLRSAVVVLGALVWLGDAVRAQQVVAPAAAPAPAPAPTPAAAVNGRIEQHAGLTVVRLWGTPDERGYAHGRLLADRFVAAAVGEFSARFARKQALLQQARAAVGRLIEYPDDVQQELDGLWRGLVDSKVDLRMPELDRAFDRTDLQVANALDVFGLMGCSSFTVWGEQAVGGGVLTARNFDWPFTGPHMLDHTIVIVQHLGPGRAVAAVSWPGYVGSVTGVSRDGVAAFLHVGSGTITYTPEPSSWPTAIAARALLAAGAGPTAGDVDAMAKKARELLDYTSPPAGFLTHVVLPVAPRTGSPALVFETDAQSCVQAHDAADACVLTNHFRTRSDGRQASKDSLDRERSLQTGIGGCLEIGDQRVSVDEAWELLGKVQRGGKRGFGTLHALVFRHEPWHFELRVAGTDENGLVAAPASARRHVLTRTQLFGDGEPGTAR